MKSLYLHGLYSEGLTQEKTDVMKMYDLEVNAPLIDYFSKDLAYFENLVETNKPDILIGSSMGGRMAYYLSNKYQLPALLFNPAIGHSACEAVIPISSYLHDKKHKKQLFVFGEFDDEVSSSDVLENVGYEVEYLSIEDMTHQVSAENIDTAMFYFFDMILNNE